MPELPEVETIAKALRDGGRGAPSLLGKSVTAAKVLWHKTVEKPSPRTFKKRIVGQRVEDIGRRAKYIVIRLTQDTLLIHLRMSGDILVGEAKEPLGSHPRLVLWFEDDYQLAFNNPRKFGRVWLLKDPQEIFDKLGPEPLDPALTDEIFTEKLLARKRRIKPLLLDQGFIAGIGNIYADEALNLAQIHPNTPANTLIHTQAAALLAAIRSVLKEGIRRNGASIDWVYQGGGFQNYFRVYDREGEECLSCGTLIEKIVVGQRGTHFCPSCQVLP